LKKRVIELGVGTSRNLDLYPQYCSIVGVDYSPKALEIALSKNTATNIDYSLQDLEK
jgi:ubiquinone/menaquinone biosynthesis C-methylase UbiE